MPIWLIIIISAFTALALIRLDWAVLLLVASLPAYLIRFKIFGLPFTLLETMILISFAVWFFKFFWPDAPNIIKNLKNRWAYPFAHEIILLIIFSFIAAGISGFSNGALGVWKAYFFEPILVYLLIFNIFKNKAELSRIIWALLISAIAVSLFALFQKITGLFIANPMWAAAGTRRAVSFFGYPNAVGLYLGPLILIFIGWLFSLNEKDILKGLIKKIIISLTIVSSLLAIYAARSEGALIGIAVSLFVFGLFAGGKQRIAAMFLLITIIGGVFWFAPASGFIVTKLSLHDLSGQIRRQQWKETAKMLEGWRTITGAGLDNYQNSIKPYHQEGIFFNSDNRPNFDAVVWASSTLRAKYWQPVEIYLYPHNIILNFWSELGLGGLLVFLWIIIKYLIISWKLAANLGRRQSQEKYLVLGLMAAMITIIVHGAVDVPYFKNDLAVMFWLLIALLGFLNLDNQRIISSHK